MRAGLRHDGGMSNHHDARDRWRKLIREQDASGLSASAFCRGAGVSLWSFYTWRRRLRDEATFAEVKIASNREGTGLPTSGSGEAIRTRKKDIVAPVEGEAAGEIELRLPGRRCVVVHPGFDRSTLIELVRILEQSAPGMATCEAAS